VASPSDLGQVDLGKSQAVAEDAARHWNLRLGPRFKGAAVSYVAPAGTQVIKVAYDIDDESLHEGDALRLWAGDGAVRLLDSWGRALLIERADPGTELALLPESEASAVAVELASRLWRRAQMPFRPVVPAVRGWLAHAGRESALVPRAWELLTKIEPSAAWVVHGDFHHHNILRHGDRHVVIDPKPYLADREYDVPSFLWNPIGNQLDSRELLEMRIAAFVAAGLDEFRIRAWTVIRGAYLRPLHADAIVALMD
jgi:streptomycin 6-kinase